MVTVVHCKREAYDVYIGRGYCPRTGKKSEWGNPFLIGRDGDREEVIDKYREYLLNSPELIEKLPTLKDKRLGCWCYPQACHGEVLKELVDAL